MANIASFGSSLMSAGSSVMAGRSRYSEGMTEALIAESQAKDTDLQSLQISERRREDLRATMAAITASRAARGLSNDSPSAIAVERELRRQSVRDEGAERYGLRSRAWALRLQAKARRKGAKMALTQGYLNAAGTVLGGAGDFMSSAGSVVSGGMSGGASSGASTMGGGAGGG